MRLRLVVLVVVVAALAACGGGEPVPGDAGVQAPAHPPASPEEDGKKGGDGFDFTVTTFTGETFRLADHRGTPVVLNFWESW